MSTTRDRPPVELQHASLWTCKRWTPAVVVRRKQKHIDVVRERYHLESASAIGKRLGISRNAVIGIERDFGIRKRR